MGSLGFATSATWRRETSSEINSEQSEVAGGVSRRTCLRISFVFICWVVCLSVFPRAKPLRKARRREQTPKFFKWSTRRMDWGAERIVSEWMPLEVRLLCELRVYQLILVPSFLSAPQRYNHECLKRWSLVHQLAKGARLAESPCWNQTCP